MAGRGIHHDERSGVPSRLTSSLTSVVTDTMQVLMPLLQGTAWTLAVAGWRHWNGAAKFSGQTVGARIRRWWWSVNDWKLPDSKLKDKELAEGAAQFYTGHANVGSD